MRRIFIIVIAVVLLITLIALVLIWIGGRESFTNENTNTLTNQPVVNTNTPLTNTPTVNTNIAAPDAQSSLRGQGRSFAELFASWSRSEFGAYLSTLDPWLTDSFAEQLPTNHESLEAARSLESVTSQVLTSEFRSWEPDTAARLEFVMDRTEHRSGESDVRYYETLLVDYVAVNGTWLVNGVEWRASRVQPE